MSMNYVFECEKSWMFWANVWKLIILKKQIKENNKNDILLMYFFFLIW